MNLKEAAKFACGFEAFHALANAYFWSSQTSLALFGVATTPMMHLTSAVVNAGISIALGLYGWRRRIELDASSDRPR